MLRIILAQFRGRPRRTLALLAGMLVATTGFTVLSASTSVQRLQVEQTVEASERPQFDILVRPKGSRSEFEEERGLVAPNYLSGLYGGITQDQLAEVRGAGHVEVAAPIGMLGYAVAEFHQEVDLTDRVDPTARQQLFRLTPEWITDRGLTVLDDAPQYVYLTRNELLSRIPVQDSNGVPLLRGCFVLLEVYPDGHQDKICHYNIDVVTGTTPVERTEIHVRRMDEAGRFTDPEQLQWTDPTSPEPPPADRLLVPIAWRVLVPVAAIDPASEADLAHLDDAIVSGRYLTADEPMLRGAYDLPAFPTLVADGALIDEQLNISVERFDQEQAAQVGGRQWTDLVPQLAGMAGTPGGPPVHVAGEPDLDEAFSVDMGTLYQPGPVSYRTDEEGTLHPEVVPAPTPETWTIGKGSGALFAHPPPRTAMSDGFRPLVQKGGGPKGGPSPDLVAVGVYDQERLGGLLDAHATPQATGADDRSRELLGDQPLRPGAGATGYVAGPPLILTNFTAIRGRDAVNSTAAISAIRVRVAGVTGVDQRSQELVRATAEDIATRTGLDVDVMLGSSPSRQTVVLPASADGRPELTVTEMWTLKGAAVAIVQAADRKSLLLFALILLVCTLFLGNAVAAAVRDRRRELAVLTCLGWPAGRLAGTVFVEVLAVGVVAGALAAAAALPLAGVLGIPLSIGHALLGLPASVGIALLAATPAAVAASRASATGAVYPAVLGVRRARRHDSVLGLALANLWRVPGRTALGVGALAVAVGALTMLVLIAVVFRNDVVGSLLGDAVAVRVRSVDLLAAVTAVALGALMVADVLYINVRERAAELAALWAGGWSNGALLRLVGYEGLGMGMLGGALGAVAGLLGAIWFAGELSLGMVLLAVVVAAGATMVAGVAAILPALVLRRLPLSTVLAEE